MDTVPKPPDDLQLHLNFPDYSKQLLAVKEISSCRPPAIRKYDQIYMKDSDLLVQTLVMAPILANKTVLFVGDGDSMSLSVLSIAALGFIPSPAHCIVLDFDKRILQFLESYASQHGFSNKLTTIAYNVIDPLPETLLGKCDYFYTNPPYGSANGGKSIIAFLTRCLEGSKELCGGCIIIPINPRYSWSMDVLDNVKAFLHERGLEISCILPDMHGYHLDDNPELRSSTILVERCEKVQPFYKSEKLPIHMLKNFYGRRDIRIPRYIPMKNSRKKKAKVVYEIP